jgi:hypothetical protein
MKIWLNNNEEQSFFCNIALQCLTFIRKLHLQVNLHVIFSLGCRTRTHWSDSCFAFVASQHKLLVLEDKP